MAALATPEDLDAYLTGDEQAILAQASAAVQSYCGWHIAPQLDETLVVDGAGGHRLRLPTFHLVGITQVHNDEALIETDQLHWSEAGWLELEYGTWSVRPRGITAEVTHGYLTPPPDVVEVVVSIAARAKSSPTGAVREQAGQVSISYSTMPSGVAGGIGLLDHEKAILSKYRIPASA